VDVKLRLGYGRKVRWLFAEGERGREREREGVDGKERVVAEEAEQGVHEPRGCHEHANDPLIPSRDIGRSLTRPSVQRGQFLHSSPFFISTSRSWAHTRVLPPAPPHPRRKLDAVGERPRCPTRSFSTCPPSSGLCAGPRSLKARL
jgi:hypothetical protein